MQPGYPPPPGYQGYPSFQPPPKRGGFPTWAIVLLASLGAFLVIGIAVVLLAVSGMRSYLSASKTAEATSTIGQISRSSIDAYEREDFLLTGTIPSKHLCKSTSYPIPTSMTSVSARKYQSSSVEWTLDSPGEGWTCLEFEMMQPQYYQYDYRMSGIGSSIGDKYTAQARGDLDGDGDYSTFTLEGRVASGNRVVADPSPTIIDAKE